MAIEKRGNSVGEKKLVAVTRSPRRVDGPPATASATTSAYPVPAPESVAVIVISTTIFLFYTLINQICEKSESSYY